MAENLEPCPFRGGSRIVIGPCELRNDFHEAACVDCGAKGPDATNETDALRLWNRYVPISDDGFAAMLDVEYKSLRPLRDALIEQNRRQLLEGSENLNQISSALGIPLSKMIKDYEIRLESKPGPPEGS